MSIDPHCVERGCYMFAPGTPERTACERDCYLWRRPYALPILPVDPADEALIDAYLAARRPPRDGEPL